MRMSPAKRFKRVYIEISNICNLQCEFCPEVVREKKIMSRGLFENIVKQVAPLTEQVCFHLMGEPLLHKDLKHFLDVCSDLELSVNLTTNATLLDSAKAEMLLSSIVKQVNFSLQSFESNFGARDDSVYLDRIFNFVEKALSARPDLYVNFRLWNLESLVEAQNLQTLAKISKRFRVDLKPLDHFPRKKRLPIKGRASVHFDSRFKWPSLLDEMRSDAGFCYGLKSHFGILADGRLVPCCLDKEGVITLGNCAEQSIQEILSSPRAVQMKLGFEKFQLSEELCRKCTFISRFDSKVPRERGAHHRDYLVQRENQQLHSYSYRPK